MRAVYIVILVAFIGFGSYWLYENNSTIRNLVEQHVDTGQFMTLEAKYTPEQIMEAHSSELLGDDKHSYQEPALKFYPYLLLEVKYTQPDKKTRETVVLWGMEDGEIVLNTDNWETTHGFDDAIASKADRGDFKIMNLLASRNNSMTREDIQKALQLEPEAFDEWIESAKQKHLIVQSGNVYQLHFQNPKILVAPQTKISQWLVTKPYNHAMRVQKRFSKGDIERTAIAAFGNDFTIRSSKEVFLPVYNISVQNPDGSVRTSYWNALNGQRIYPRFLSAAKAG